MEEIPTLDGYIGLKLSLERLEWRNKVLQRQKNIENLKKQNERSYNEKREQREFAMKMNYNKGGRPSPNTVMEGRRKEKIDLNMPTTSLSHKKIGVETNDEIGGKIAGERVKSAGCLKMKTKQGNLFRGPTFDLVYTVPSIASPLPRRENQQRQDYFEL